MTTSIKKVAILTSGGDAPGMNAAIRAITLGAIANNIQVIGFKNGYNGLLADSWQTLDQNNVTNIIGLGGTILKSARCPKFAQISSAQSAAQVLQNHQIDVLFIIGGDGSFRGALHLGQHWQGQIIGLPGTIDNDLDGTDATIGYYTAMNTALEAIDKIRDTANAFERIFVVEVMGRHCGCLALNVGIASGAEQIVCNEFYPDGKITLDDIAKNIKYTVNQHHDASYIIVLMENLWPGGATDLAKQLQNHLQLDCRPAVLGHIQRGGSAVSIDRILATELGIAAVNAAIEGKNAIMLGQVNGQINHCPLSEAIKQHKKVDKYLLKIQNEVFCVKSRDKQK